MLQAPPWKKIFRFQEKSCWCGPAVIQMALLSGGIEKSQKEIADDVYHPWWGTTQQGILAYLSQFFKNVGFEENSTIASVKKHLEAGRIVIVNWWDDIDPQDAEGHYSLVIGYKDKEDKVALADPSAGRGIWDIDRKLFESKWYDFLDEGKKIKIEKWMLWLDPTVKI